MQRKLLISLLVFSGLITNIVYAQVPFHKGVNLTNWFQSGSAEEIPFGRFTKTDFQQIKSLGCDVIRLPINLHAMTGGSPDYKIDPLLLRFLDSAVTWAESCHIYLILDNHSFDPAVNTDPNVANILKKVWQQMAIHFRDRSPYVMYEILNEPHGIDDNLWNQIQSTVIGIIRQIDTVHTIVVGPANWNSYADLKNLEVYPDKNLIYTFHFYDPMVFTHQGATWTSPSLKSLSGVPFPYDPSRMPACPPGLAGTWVNNDLDRYATLGNMDYITGLLQEAVDFKNKNHVPVFCGEFGVYRLNSNNSDRVAWYEGVRKFLEENNIPWTIWDYKGGFGLFNRNSNELFDNDLNIPLLRALGLNVPPQKPFKVSPDTIGFNLYRDFIEPGINESDWAAGGKIDFYSEELPAQGTFCIDWEGGDQYSNIGFDFVPDKDLSRLVAGNYELEFLTRGSTPDLSYDVRFLDTKTADPGSHPWRMGTTISSATVPWNGSWQLVKIPLENMRELGAWDNNTWYDPEGKFDWSFAIIFRHQGNSLK